MNSKSPGDQKSVESLANQLIPKESQFVTKAEALKQIDRIVIKSVEWHLELWSDDPEVRKKQRAYMAEHPLEARARERSAALFLSKYAQGAEKPAESNEPPPRDVTIEELKERNLSDKELRKLAGIDEKK